MTQNEEYIVLEKIASGDHDAFRYVFMTYFPKVKYFITNIVKSDVIAEELAQDIFLKVWTTRESLPELRSFNAYIYKMARNTALNYLDRKYVEEAYLANYTPSPNAATNPVDELEAKELELLVQLTVDQMPEQRRRIYTMSRIENLKNEEIAEKLNLSKKTVENHLNLALKDIRNVLAAALFFFI